VSGALLEELGLGGVDRGPGTAPLLWGEETEGDASRFEARSLEDARYADPAHAALLEVGASDPEVAPEAESAGLVEVEGSSGGPSWRRRLSPHHRRAVREFFAPPDSSAARQNRPEDD